MKDIVIVDVLDGGVTIPVRVVKTAPTAATKATEAIPAASFSLPMQDALSRTRQAFGFTHFSQLFDDDEAYTEWIRRHHPENMPYGED